MSTTPDLCIIGAGALGIDLALYARRLGVDVVLAERDQPEPGDLAQQALRTASLAESARRVEDLRRAAEVGLGAVEAKFSARQIAERASRLVLARGRATSPEILKARGITLMRGPVSFAEPRAILVGDITIKPRRVLVAIGGTCIIPDIPGLADTAYFTSDSIIENQRKLTHLLVIGGNAAAFEQAQMQRRLGAEVTLVPQGPILAGFDPECVEVLMAALADEGVQIRPGAQVVTVNARTQGVGVEVEGEGGMRESLDVSHLLVSVGRRADLVGLSIDKARLKPGTDPRLPFLRGPLGTTSSRTIRLAGFAGGQESWSEAQAHGRAIIDSLFGARRRPLRVPRLVDTEPGMAQIGPPVERVDRPRAGALILRENFSENDRAAAMARDRGLVKVAVNGQGQVQRAAIVGPGAAELAAVLALAMDRKIGLAPLADLPLPQPSLFSILARLGENYLASRPLSPSMRRGKLLRRLWPW